MAWIQPVPDALVTDESTDPAAVVAARDSLRLALIASLQYLPPKQRAVLILREVLAFPAAEVATMLDTSVPAVKSLLQRARARLDEVAPADQRLDEPTEPEEKALLDKYIAAFQNADIGLLEEALREDAALEMVGSRTWFAGNETCLAYIRRFLGTPGEWRMVPTRANGQPATVTYANDSLFGVAVLDVTRAGIARIVVFGGADVAKRFLSASR